MYGSCPTWGTFTPSGETIKLTAVDTDLTATIALGKFTGTDPKTKKTYDEPGISTAVDFARHPDAWVSGAAESLLLHLWHRSSPDTLISGGKEDILHSFWSILSAPLN
jgi:hypothetical protein